MVTCFAFVGVGVVEAELGCGSPDCYGNFLEGCVFIAVLDFLVVSGYAGDGLGGAGVFHDFFDEVVDELDFTFGEVFHRLGGDCTSEIQLRELPFDRHGLVP